MRREHRCRLTLPAFSWAFLRQFQRKTVWLLIWLAETILVLVMIAGVVEDERVLEG